MASIGDVLDKLKSTIIQTKTQKVDAKLDKAVADIISYRSNSGRNGYIDVVRSLISKNAQINVSGAGGGLFSQGGVTPATFGQGSRLYRYKSYQAIVSNINYAIRALDVLVDNILSPDDITKQVLEIKPQNQLTEVDSSVRYVKDVVKHIKLERKLDTIVRNTLLSGDLFCEIGTAKTALTSQTLLSEALNYQQKIDERTNNGILEKITEKIKDGNIELTLDYSSLLETDVKPKTSKKKTKKERRKGLNNLHLIFHDPQFVVKLQSSLFPICFGFLVFPVRAALTGATLADDAINNICVAIVKSLRNKIPQMQEYSDDDELKSILSALVRNTDLNKSMDIRYVPPDKMVHFCRTTTKYHPYGESIFDSCQYTAKVLISLETALAVQRLARSTEKRKIAIEVGLPRDARKAIELMKEEFRKRKVSLDSFGTVDTIPSLITTFEDVYIPQKDGKPFVDISTFTEGNVDVRSKVDELKFMRDQMVASLGVPPAFIGIEESLCSRLDTKIPLINGQTLTLKEIIEKFNNNESVSVYSCNKEGKIVPGKIIWAGVTKTNTKCVRVWLDNDEYIDCTPEHPFMLRDGTYKEAQLLEENESLMPFYKRVYKYAKTKRGNYFEVYHPGINVWELIYKSFSNYWKIYPDNKNQYQIHHINMNPCDNRFENLVALLGRDHMTIHGRLKSYFTEQELEEIVQDRSLVRKEIIQQRKVAGLNHKVEKVEILEGRFDTGDIAIEKYHNFAVSAGVIVHNSNKNALSEENILFARTIISHQKYLTHQIQELVQKIFDIIDPDEALTILDDVEVVLPVPRSLQFEREARYMNEMSTLVENLERIGIPKEYSSKKYMSQMDWDEIKKYEISQKIDQTIDPSKKDEDVMGGGMAGGFGGGM